MPAATTHVIFAKEVYERLPQQIQNEITNKHMFYLGSQGPDMLFFHRASVLPGSLKKYGDMLHEEKIWDVIQFFEEYSANDRDLFSYYLGYLCHYALDSQAHPLIFAYARSKSLETGDNEGVIHVTSEGAIDVWLLNQRGRKISSYDVYKDIHVSHNDRKKLSVMYFKMLKKIFNIDVKVIDVYTAIQEISSWTHFIAPRQTTYNLIHRMETMFKMPHGISGMMLVNKTDFSIINLDHKKYPLIFDETKTISASFPELYGKAIFKACRLLDHHDKSDFNINFSGSPY